MGLLGNLFGGGPDLTEVMSKGAMIIDVRTPGEFRSGNVKGSKNIPLDRIPSEVENIKKHNKPVILCCASGMRSGNATHILKQHGVEAYNGGSWTKVNSMVQR